MFRPNLFSNYLIKKRPQSKSISNGPLLMYSANVKDSENDDRWLAALSSSIVH